MFGAPPTTRAGVVLANHFFASFALAHSPNHDAIDRTRKQQRQHERKNDVRGQSIKKDLCYKNKC